jgi:phage FluMu gp28-like protein
MPALPLYPYQQRWFADRSRYKLGRWSRQTGKTFTTSLEIVDDCFAAESTGGRTKWVILSRGERQSREAMDAVKMHARAYSLAIEEIETDYALTRDDGSRASYKQLEITLPGGSRIIGLPANPDTARGFSANVFLDEFAFHSDSREIWKALFPVISAGFRLVVTSTPNGKGNKFYELASGKSPRWSRHKVDIHTAVADGLPRDIDELREGIDDDDAWRQEYELEWLDEASAWLPWDLITSVEHDAAGDPAGYQGGPCYVGNDIARRGDLWVAWVWEQVGDVLWTREISILKGATFAAHDAELDRIVGTRDTPGAYRVVALAMDQTGMGEKPVEDAKRRYGEQRVQGVLFSGPAKLGMATHAKQQMQDRRVRIPMGDRRLRADLHSLRKINTPSGAPRFDAAADEEGTDSHADRAWAAFLGLDAASAAPWSADWTPAPSDTGWLGQARDSGAWDEAEHDTPVPVERFGAVGGW